MVDVAKEDGDALCAKIALALHVPSIGRGARVRGSFVDAQLELQHELQEGCHARCRSGDLRVSRQGGQQGWERA